jgi:hypothetical protein
MDMVTRIFIKGMDKKRGQSLHVPEWRGGKALALIFRGFGHV